MTIFLSNMALHITYLTSDFVIELLPKFVDTFVVALLCIVFRMIIWMITLLVVDLAFI